jgi:hypothetical protein
MLPGIPDVRENGGQGHDLGLIRKVEDPVDVEHVQELGGLHEPLLDPRLVSLVGLERKIEQRKYLSARRLLCRGSAIRDNFGVISVTVRKDRHRNG